MAFSLLTVVVATHAPFVLVLLLSFLNRLPLHVAWIVLATSAKRYYVVDDVALAGKLG
jgi:hypothetical protein